MHVDNACRAQPVAALGEPWGAEAMSTRFDGETVSHTARREREKKRPSSRMAMPVQLDLIDWIAAQAEHTS